MRTFWLKWLKRIRTKEEELDIVPGLSQHDFRNSISSVLLGVELSFGSESKEYARTQKLFSELEIMLRGKFQSSVVTVIEYSDGSEDELIGELEIRIAATLGGPVHWLGRGVKGIRQRVDGRGGVRIYF